MRSGLKSKKFNDSFWKRNRRVCATALAAIVFFTVTALPARADLQPLPGWEASPLEKAALFEWKLHLMHDVDGMILSDIRLSPRPDGGVAISPAYDDSGYWTGNYLLGESLRYAVTGSPEAKEHAERSARALIRMLSAAGAPGLPVRGYMDASQSSRFSLSESYLVRKSADGSRYLSLDVSVDQFLGIMQGLHFVCRFVADEPLKAEIAQAVSQTLDRLVRDDYVLLDLDGRPTTFGVFTPGAAISHLHAFLILSIFRMGAYMTGEPRHMEAYRSLRDDAGYGRRARQPKFMALQNHSDDAMEYMGYINFFLAETDPAARRDVLAGLKRTWKATRHFDKSFFNLIALQYIDDLPDRERILNETLEQIRTFPTLKEHWSADYSGRSRPDLRRPNPPQFRPADGYYWTTDPFVAGQGKDPGQLKISSGIDYLMVYWLARHWGYLDR